MMSYGNSDDPIVDRLDLARAIAREAGRLTLEHFQKEDLEIERKEDASPVTVADRVAEQHLRRRILAEFPQDGIVGEEFGETKGASDFRWVLDPIDGTKSFIHGVPLYTTLVGVEYDDRSVAGVIYAPATDEMVYAALGYGSWYIHKNQPPRQARVSTVKSLAESCLLTSEVANFTRCRDVDAMDTYLQLQNTARIARTWGDAYGYMMVAVGRAEVMIDPVMNLWDAAAIQPILEEAGGTFTDWTGTATTQSGEGIGTNGWVLDEVLALTRPLA